jgi:cell division septal protein FtsQ
MARVDLPQSRLRARRRRKRLIIAGFFAAVFFVIVGALALLSRAPFLRISAVNIVGAQSVATSSIDALVRQQISGAYWYLFAKDDIFLYSKPVVVSALEAHYPMLKQIDVHAQDFHTIVVSVIERQPVALWCGDASSTNCFDMDEDGIVYASASDLGNIPTPSGSVTYLGALSGTRLPQQYLTSDQFHSLFALVSALSQKVGSSSVMSVAVDENHDAEAHFANGFLLKFALADASGDIFDRFALALRSDPFKTHQLTDFQYLDLRFGDKLYYKLKGQ